MKQLTPTQAYIISFLLIAMWAVFAYLTMLQQIQAHEHYAKLINISGKQRMLSQRTALLAEQYLLTKETTYIEELNNLRDLMEQDHQYLLAHIPSEPVKNVYFNEPKNLTARVTQYLAAIDTFISKSKIESSEALYEKASTLLPLLDYAVKTYENQSQNKTEQLKRIERYILAGTLLTLILEAFFILRPTLRKAALNMLQLEEMVKEKTTELNAEKEKLTRTVDNLKNQFDARKKSDLERVELEKQLRKKYKMEALGTMAGGISHNFNNSLALVLGSLELALRKCANADTERLLKQARTGVFQARDLIKQLLAYSRQEDVEMTPVCLYDLVTENLTMIKNTVPSSVILKNDLNPITNKIFTCANVGQIQECLLNLCNNAIQAMNEKGELAISLDIQTLNPEDMSSDYAATPGTFLRLSVSDTGCGIDIDTQTRIFDLFFSTKDPNKGTGIGLSTVRGIIMAHQGLIKIQSELGQGTTFELYFAVHDAGTKEACSIDKSNQSLPTGKEHILLVDDEKQVAHVTETMLQELGYKVSVFLDSPKALESFHERPDLYDILITDQTMPVLTGRKLINVIRETKSDFPAILCTGFSNLINRDQALKEGIEFYLEKPIGIVQLAHTVRDALDQKREDNFTGADSNEN